MHRGPAGWGSGSSRILLWYTPPVAALQGTRPPDHAVPLELAELLSEHLGIDTGKALLQFGKAQYAIAKVPED
jgi:hypothetical protein